MSMGYYTKITKKIAYIGIICLVFLGIFLFVPKTAYAFDPVNWTEQADVLIDNIGNFTDLENFPVKVQIEYKTLMNNDFSDIRFYKDGELLDYGWDISKDGSQIKENGVSATAIVNIPTIPADDNTTIKMYYGNASASPVANLSGTVRWYDDFSSDTSDSYTVPYGSWNWDSVNNQLESNSYYNSSAIYPTYLSVQDNLRARIKYKQSEWFTDPRIKYKWIDQDNYLTFNADIPAGTDTWGKMINGNWSVIDDGNQRTNKDVWTMLESKINDNEHSVWAYRLDVESGRAWNDTFDDLLNETGKYYLNPDTHGMAIDYLYIRQYTDPLPTSEIAYPLKLDYPPEITSPSGYSALGGQAKIEGTTYYDNVTFYSPSGHSSYLATTKFDGAWKHKNYKSSMPIHVNYTTSTTGGFLEMGLSGDDITNLENNTRNDYNDMRIVKYNTDTKTFSENDVDFWYSDDLSLFKFYVEPEADIDNPVYKYYLEFNFKYEQEPPEIISEPTTVLTGYLESWLETEIKGTFQGTFYPPEAGTYNIYAKSWVPDPNYIETELSDPATITFPSLELYEPDYIWSEPTLWYQEHSDYDEPTQQLQYFFDTIGGVVENTMLSFNRFSGMIEQIDREQATDDLSGGVLTLISYSRLLNEICGDLPITWAITLLFVIWILKIVIKFIIDLIKIIRG